MTREHGKGTIFFDPDKAPYSLHVDGGTAKMKARHMVRKTVNQTRSQMRGAGIKAYQGVIKV